MRYNDAPEMSLEPPDEQPAKIRCIGCGVELYEGDKYYPKLDVCEYCLPHFEERVGY